ncbi:hypothetical protein B0I35DRAFT_110908 [Stachybotrys elegans]|uniref:Uncharacterized protein n=1 Tax=Stachybotrys elegans TaxID=80388 RepID=A0A8K0WLU1_9HYPO|nr:hypothetical protein B0I35DRAFT_110908 [Stachybotrys elegans]
MLTRDKGKSRGFWLGFPAPLIISRAQACHVRRQGDAEEKFVVLRRRRSRRRRRLLLCRAYVCLGVPCALSPEHMGQKGIGRDKRLYVASNLISRRASRSPKDLSHGLSRRASLSFIFPCRVREEAISFGNELCYLLGGGEQVTWRRREGHRMIIVDEIRRPCLSPRRPKEGTPMLASLYSAGRICLPLPHHPTTVAWHTCCLLIPS